MSGLASFLSSFLPDKENNYEYNESIANVPNNKDYDSLAASPVIDPKTQSATEWRAERNDNLREYMEKRMISNEEQDNDDDSPHKEIPHVDETVHVCHTLADLDMYTRQFHLKLGIVEQTWPLRTIPRREYITSSKFEDDGPLGTLFKKVVCLEVTQLCENDQVTNMAQAAFGGAPHQKRIKVYFYNKYAQQISDFLERQIATRILISLNTIPAKCILPVNNTEDYKWNERDSLSPYCLCIGDKSSMKLDQDGVLEKVPFDSVEISVTIARVSSSGETVEMDVTHDSVREGGALVFKEEETLETAHQEWEKNHQEKLAENEEEQQEQEEGEVVDADAGTTRRADFTTANDGRAKKKARTETKYHTLSELRGIHNARKGGEKPVVNVFCAVLGFSSPTMSRGYDYQVNVTLVDDSLPLPTAGEDDVVAATPIIIFCKEKDNLPQILKAGDVLRLHRVAVQEWNDDIQLLGKRSSSFVVVRPEDTASTSADDEWNIVPTAKGGTVFEQKDRERAATLWKWAQNRLANYPTIHKPSAKLTLADLAPQEQPHVREEKTGDLTVMVSSIIIVPDALRSAATPLCYLRVWDGTGAASSDPLPCAAVGAAEAIKNGDPPSEALQAIANAVETIKAVDNASTLEPPKSLCGRVMNVAVWEEPDLQFIKFALQVGSFIRLRNVHECRILSGLRCVGISSKSYLTPLPNDTYEVKEMLKDHQRRVLAKDPFNPQSGVLPLEEDAATAVAAPAPAEDAMHVDETHESDARGDGMTSLARCISEAAPSSFEVKFHITGTIPTAEEGNHPLQCLCNGGKYQFAVNVNDETAAIDALVPGEVGRDLFQLEATDASALSTSGAVAAMKDVTRQDKLWKGVIRSFELNGSRFFIIDSIEAA